MTTRRRLTVYDFETGRTVGFDGPANRFLFVVDGSCRLTDVDGTVWLCETAAAEVPFLSPALASVALSKAVTVAGAAPQVLFRVDRIDLTAGAGTPRHFHRGPGVRRLLFGRVRVEIGDDVYGVGPGGAWFEPGDDPVVGENVFAGDSAFLRVSLLPVELEGGKSSFIPASDAEAAKPRAVGQGLLHEAIVPIG